MMRYGTYGVMPTPEFGLMHMLPHLFLGLAVCFAIVAVIIYAKRNHVGHHMGLHPIEILKQRYAKGELSKEQFKEMKKELED